MQRLLLLVCGLGLVVSGAACEQSDFDRNASGGNTAGDGDGDGDGPGSGVLDDDVACSDDDDCAVGETCIDQVCQMRRCFDGPYDSEAPLGARLKFGLDRELIVADTQAIDGDFYVDGYAPTGATVDYPGSWNIGADQILDVAGGDLLGTEPELFATVVDGDKSVKLSNGNAPVSFAWQPIAVATGDVDRDKTDELAVLGQFGNLAVCDIDEGSCREWTISNANGVDVAVADVDGDGYDEPVLLLDQQGNRTYFILQTDADINGDEDSTGPITGNIDRIAAGDLQDDGVAELVGLETGGTFNDVLYTYTVAAGQVAQADQMNLPTSTEDVAMGDLDLDGQSEILTVRNTGIVEVLRGTAQSSIVSDFTHQLQVTQAPNRISASDFDGDSPASRLVDESPELLASAPVPIAVLHFPPYNAERSADVSNVAMGRADLSGESLTDSISLSAGVDVGISADLGPIFKSKFSAGVSKELSFSETETRRVTIGERVSIEPDPDFFGFDHAAVMLTCSCFHAYEYEVIDPDGLLGGDGERFMVVTPVGGNTTVWSSNRYNAMAEAVGNLPLVEVPYTLGDPTSYPETPTLPDGSPVPPNDMLFPSTPSLAVSDIGNVGFNLGVRDTVTNTNATSVRLDIKAGLGVGPFQFGANVGVGTGESYSVTVGEQAVFSGSVPPIRDDPATPEDEYLTYGYAYSPYVYRATYTDAAGNPSGYYVVSYTVGR